MIISNCKIICKDCRNRPRKNNKIKKITDLNKTISLNTAIIEKEWINKLNKDIFEGPKYLRPLIESISLYSGKFFLIVPEKLLHRLFWLEIKATSFFIKQE